MSFILLASQFCLQVCLLLLVLDYKLRLEGSLFGFNFVLKHQVLQILLGAEVDLSKLRIRKLILIKPRDDLFFS